MAVAIKDEEVYADQALCELLELGEGEPSRKSVLEPQSQPIAVGSSKSLQSAGSQGTLRSSLRKHTPSKHAATGSKNKSSKVRFSTAFQQQQPFF